MGKPDEPKRERPRDINSIYASGASGPKPPPSTSARRDPFKRPTVEELEALPTIRARNLDPPLHLFVIEVKQEEHGYQYCLVRDTRRPEMPARVVVLEHRAGEWTTVHPLSLTRVVDGSERAAMEAADRGNHVLALLLVHAIIEAMMRADPLLRPRDRDGFAGVALAFKRRLIERAIPSIDPEDLHARLTKLNGVRNNVVHLWLGLHGLEGTNERLAGQFAEWKDTYYRVIIVVMEYMSM